MEIYDLNTGTLGDNDYMAVDDGTDTRKVNVKNLLAGKVDVVTGKGLSTNDFTTAEKNKLAGIEAQANKTVVDSSLSTSSTNPVQNKVITGEIDGIKEDFVNKTIAEYGIKDIGTLTSGKYVLQTTGGLSSSSSWSYSGYVPVNGKSLLFTCPLATGNTQLSYVAAIAFYSTNGTSGYLGNQPILYGTTGTTKWILASIPSTAKYIRLSVYNSSASSYKMVEIPFVDVNGLQTQINTINGSATYTAAFTSANQVVSTDIPVKAGTVYHINAEPYSASTIQESKINVFSNGSGGSANYVIIRSDFTTADLVPAVDGMISLFNGHGYIGDITLTVTSNLSRVVDDEPITYYVSSAEGTYKSLTGLLLQLKDDKREKTIIVEGGDYDIFQEYKDLQSAGLIPAVPSSDYDPSTGYVPYNVFIPDNTHIIGKGYVRLIYAPDAADTTTNESKTLSPINVAGSMTIENVEIYCKNGRYCIHDDPVQDAQYSGARKKYINVKAIKDVNDSGYGYSGCFGCGVSREMDYSFENCIFDNKISTSGAKTFYCHDRKVVGGENITEKRSSRITAKNCVFLSTTGVYGVFFGNIGAADQGVHIRVSLDSCYTNAAIVSADDASNGSGNNANSFDIQVLFCKYANLVIRDANNQYAPQIYNY